MKKTIFVIFIPFIILSGQSKTFYSDWGWGYYFWLFGPVGPNHSEGVAAAGYSSLEYRGYNQFSLGGYPGAGTEIQSLVLRLRNNTGGSGLQIDINRVTSNTPDWDECGGTTPFYLTYQAVEPNPEDYSYFDLSGTQAKADLLVAWENGASWFGLGYKGSRGSGEPCMHFFYAFWADEMLDAALLVDYTIGIEENEEMVDAAPVMSVSPNPFRLSATIKFQIPNSKSQNPATFGGMLKIYNAAGQVVKSFNLCDLPQSVLSVSWNGTDQVGQSLASGVYFIHYQINGATYVKPVVLVD